MCFRDRIFGLCTFKRRHSTTNKKDRLDTCIKTSNKSKGVALRTFLGMVQYYQDMWKSQIEIITPLTDLVGECGQKKLTKAKVTNTSPWYRDKINQKAFDQVKATICQYIVLAYSDFSKPFKIYTDASANQLGAVIAQDSRPLAFFSRKLSDTQK